MNWTIPVTVGVAIVGWYVAHRLSAWRDRVNRRSEERVHHLVSAYQTLAQIRGHHHACQLGNGIRIAIADIQLFGKCEQIESTVAWLKAATSKQDIAIDELDLLLESLRRDLRAEIALDPVEGKLWWVKIGPPKEDG